MLEPIPDFSPDLEWMLQSGQAPISLIIDTLVQDYYNSIYRFCLSVLDDPLRAHQATQDTFVYVVRHAHRYRSQESVQTWLYRAAYKACQRSLPRGMMKQPPNPDLVKIGVFTPLVMSSAEYEIVQGVNGLCKEDRCLIFLNEIQSFEPDAIAKIFQKETAEIEARLSKIWMVLGESVSREPGDRTELTDVCRRELEQRWPACGEADPARFNAAASIEARASQKESIRLPFWQVGVVLGAAILLLVFLFSGAGRSFFAETPATQTSTTARQANALKVSPKSTNSSPELRKSQNITPTGEDEKATDENGGSSNQLPLSPLADGEKILPERSGPASLSAVLNYWGWDGNAEEISAVLQPNPRDANSMPYELLNFIEEQTQYKAIFRVGGDSDILNRLIASGYPVIIERGINDQSGEWMGEYAVVKGYDQTLRESFGKSQVDRRIYLYPEGSERYEDLEGGWRAFNYLYILVYPPNEEAKLMEILGEDAQADDNYLLAAQKAEREIASLAGRDKFFAWFNRGTSLSYLEDYAGAAVAFDEAFKLLSELPKKQRPARILWYQSRPYWAYYYARRYEDVLNLANNILGESHGAVLEESYYWRALAKEALGDLDGAIEDLQESLYLNPNFAAGQYHLRRIRDKV